jgi:hypothetical protein
VVGGGGHIVDLMHNLTLANQSECTLTYELWQGEGGNDIGRLEICSSWLIFLGYFFAFTSLCTWSIVLLVIILWIGLC